jgi:integrase
MKNDLGNQNVHLGHKSGQDVAKIEKSPGATSRGSLARLKEKIRKNTSAYFGRSSHVPCFVIRIKQGRHRKHFQLKAGLEESAVMAKEILDRLRLDGWAKVVELYRPKDGRKVSDLTVGEYLELLAQHCELTPETLEDYSRCLRRIVGEMMNFKHSGAEKYSGGRAPSEWRTKVDKVALDQITPSAVVRWRTKYVRDRVAAGKKQECVEHTANSAIRNARSLFSKRLLQGLKLAVPTLSLPNPLPFDGVLLLKEHESDFFYHSTIDASELIRKAFNELHREELVIFVLAIGGGLRRKEIDNLEWSRVNVPNRTVTILKPRSGRLKSDSSCGIVVLEKRFMDVLEEHARRGREGYVLFPDRPAKHRTKNRSYRCKAEFERVLEWLRLNGVTQTDKPLHTMRKEFGSNISKHKGIYAASASLRHSTIALTAKYYAHRKAEETSFFNAEEPKADLSEAQIRRMIEMMKAEGLVMKQAG